MNKTAKILAGVAVAGYYVSVIIGRDKLGYAFWIFLLVPPVILAILFFKELIRGRFSKVQLYTFEQYAPYGLDSEVAISQLKKANKDVCVTHFIREKPHDKLLKIVSELEKDVNFCRLVYFPKIDNSNKREGKYAWLRDRINNLRTENRAVLHRSLPLDLLIINTDVVLAELPNMVGDRSSLLLLRDTKIAKAFRDTFESVFKDNTKSVELSLDILEKYISTGERPSIQ